MIWKLRTVNFLEWWNSSVCHASIANSSVRVGKCSIETRNSSVSTGGNSYCQPVRSYCQALRSYIQPLQSNCQHPHFWYFTELFPLPIDPDKISKPVHHLAFYFKRTIFGVKNNSKTFILTLSCQFKIHWEKYKLTTIKIF